MKHSIIILFILSTHLIMAQTPAYPNPKPLFAQYGMYVLLHEDGKGNNVYLTSVQLWKEKPYTPELDSLKHEMAFCISYGVHEISIEESFINYSDLSITAAFLKSASGTYRIMQSSYLADWSVADRPPEVQEGEMEIIPVPRSMSYDPRPPSPYTLVGNSTDTTLFAVKAWNYIREHTDDEIRKLIE